MQQVRSRGSWTRRLALLVFGLIVGPLVSRGTAACIGDCNGDGSVTVNELILMTSIALNLTPVAACRAGDVSGDGTITVNEIISAVNNALGVCPPSPSTPTPTATQNPTDTPTQTGTDTPIPTATNTVPPINTATATSAPTSTLSAASTATPTNTAAATAASSPTSTFTAPAASTATPTNTAAATAASSPTGTTTPTATTVISNSPTPTSSPSPTATTAGLGSRTFTLVAGTSTTGSGYYSSFLPTSKAGTPAGNFVLVAGGKDASGHAAVTVTGPAYLTVPVTLATLTICTKIESCTGDLYCDGGTNVDTTEKLDSLKSSLSCVQDGTKNCPSAAGNVCCSNACEGTGVGSGNPIVSAHGVNPGTDSGHGAMLLICNERVTTVNTATGVNCATQDYSASPLEPAQYTTGSSTASLSHHCAGTTAGNKANVVPTFSKTGQNFDCTNWTLATGPGAFASSLPAEQPSDLIVGDGAQAEVVAGH